MKQPLPYRPWILLPLISILIACNNEEIEVPSLQNGLYLPSDVSVEFLPPADPEASQIKLKNFILQIVDQSFFEIQDHRFVVIVKGEDDTAIITPDNNAISPYAQYDLTPQPNGSIELITQDHALCEQQSCIIKATLNPVPEDHPTIKSLEKIDLEHYKTLEPITIDIPESYILESIHQPYYGVRHTLLNALTIKLTPAQSNGLEFGIPEHTIMSAFELGDLKIDPSREDISLVTFYTNDTPSDEFSQINTISYLFIIPSEKPFDIDLSALNPEHTRYFTTDNGFVSEDENGFYTIYYRNLPTLKKAIIAVTEGLELQKILSHYRSFESIETIPALNTDKALINPHPKSHDPYEIRLKDYLLPQKTIEERYGLTQDQLFRTDFIELYYNNALKSLLTSADLFLLEGPNTQNGYHLLSEEINDFHFNNTWMKIHQGKPNAVLKMLQSANHENHLAKWDYWENPIYISNIEDGNSAGIHYLKEIQPNVTLEIFSPADQGHIAEKVLFAKMLAQLHFNNLPQLQGEAIQNIGRYHIDKNDTKTLKANETGSSYRFNEGQTNKNGSLFKR